MEKFHELQYHYIQPKSIYSHSNRIFVLQHVSTFLKTGRISSSLFPQYKCLHFTKDEKKERGKKWFSQNSLVWELSFSSVQSPLLLVQRASNCGSRQPKLLQPCQLPWVHSVGFGLIYKQVKNITAGFLVISGIKSSSFPAFYFPVENIESFVTVHPLHDMSLQAFTLCFWTKAQHAGSQTVLSYSTQERDNELVLTVGTDVGLWIGGHFISFPLYHKAQDWLHFCMTWASQSGMANLWLNGAAGKAKSIQKGYVSQAGGTLVLGKDRDTLLGAFSNGFAGWMTHVNLWSQVLSPADIRALALCRAGHPKGDIVAWGETSMTLLGGVVLESDTSCQ